MFTLCQFFLVYKMSGNIEVPCKYLIKDVKICSDRIIGTGSYAVVYIGTYHATKVAAKKLHSIFFEGVDPQEYKGILQSWVNEFKLMHSLRHPNIVQFYGVFNSDNPSSMVLNGNSYIITELLAKSLQYRNAEKPRLTIRHIIDIAMDIAAGLCYLHNRQNPIMHRDLASKNILLSPLGQAKIADLGVAKLTAQMQQSHTRHPGTDYYMPLETVIVGDIYDHSIDVYALGVIILEMATGKEPTATQSLKRVGKGFEVVPELERRRNDFNELRESPSKVLEDVIMLCLEEKESRISASEVTMHLDKLKNSEPYQSCKPSAVFEMKTTDSTSHEYQHKLIEIQQENEQLKQENERLKQEVEVLKKEKESLKIQAHEEKNNLEQEFQNKLTLLKKQGLKGDLQTAPKSVMPQKQQTAQYVPSTGGLQHLPQKMASTMVAPQHHSILTNHPPSNSAYTSGLEKPRIQSMSYSYDQTLRPSHSFNPPPTSLHQPPTSSYYVDRPPESLHNIHQPLKPLPIFDQHPQSLHYQRSESWSSDTSETPTLDYYDHIIDGDFPSRNPQLDNNFTSLPARLSNDPAIQKAREYLSYQLSCMDRVLSQLKSVTFNTSENLVTSFVETLKEQIIKTADYIRKLPSHIKSDQYLHEPLQRIHHTLSNAHFDKISYRYTQDLNFAIRNLQDALNRCMQW